MKRGNPCKENCSPIQMDNVKMPASPAMPMMPPGEDKSSHQRHLKMLQMVPKKLNPNKQIMNKLMKRTFYWRIDTFNCLLGDS